MSTLTQFYQNIFERKKESGQGFGTFVGVFVPCILMLFGVIIFLRLGWITGQVGLAMTLFIITLGAAIALLTALSMAAIATNIELGKGGVYYILSRSLGLEVGSAIGLPLFFKQSLSVAFCVVGFAESVHDLVPAWPISTIGMITLVLFTACACASLSGALKLQVAIFIALAASLVALFTGDQLRPTDPTTYLPVSTGTLGFWSVFALFFPAMTGMESSVSLSGDLRNPSRSLPLGTIGALIVAYLIYMAIPVFLVQHVPMERLANDPLVMQDLASVPALIIVGIWAATLSSALGGLLGAPRTLQAIADDGVVPSVFGITFGRKKEPIVATLTTFVIAFISIYFGSVNKLAPLLSMICLICYCVLNLSAGFETLMANPSWRPRFRVHWSVSFMGALLCLLAMLMIDAGDALLAMALVAAIFLLTKRRNLKASWEDISQGLLLFMARFAVYRLAFNPGASKSWRPHFLVFTKKPEEHSHNLVKFSQAISQSKSFLTMASFSAVPFASEKEKKQFSHSILQRLQQKKIHAMVQFNHADNITSGMQQMIENYGLGSLVPDTLLFGGIYENPTDFARVISKAFRKHRNIVILNETKHDRQETGDIHVWWDSRQANSDFMLVMAYMLQSNPVWQKATICLNGIVASELHRQTLLTQFQSLSIAQRLPFKAQVLVSQVDEFFELVASFSKEAGMIFLGLHAPADSAEEYGVYLQKITQQAEKLPPTALVLGTEFVPLDTILK